MQQMINQLCSPVTNTNITTVVLYVTYLTNNSNSHNKYYYTVLAYNNSYLRPLEKYNHTSPCSCHSPCKNCSYKGLKNSTTVFQHFGYKIMPLF